MSNRFTFPPSRLSRSNEESQVLHFFLTKSNDFNSHDRSDFLKVFKSSLISSDIENNMMNNIYKLASGLRFQYLKSKSQPIIETIHIPIAREYNPGLSEFKAYFTSSDQFTRTINGNQTIFESTINPPTISKISFIDEVDPLYPQIYPIIPFRKQVKIGLSTIGEMSGFNRIFVIFGDINSQTTVLTVTLINEFTITRNQLLSTIRQSYIDGGINVTVLDDRETLIIKFIDRRFAETMDTLYPIYKNPEENSMDDYLTARNWIIKNRTQLKNKLEEMGDDELKYYLTVGLTEIKYEIGSHTLCRIKLM